MKISDIVFNKRKEISLLKSSFIAGVLISIGCICYLRLGGILGALTFSVGLYSVIVHGAKLFTGISWEVHNVRVLLPVLLGNVLGCIVSAEISKEIFPEIVEKVIISNSSFLECLMRGIGCGILMTFSIKGYSQNKLTPLLGVTGFIIAEFSHCVADSFYYTIASHWIFTDWFSTVLGNYIGCNLWRVCKD